ncbi:unnamed protein product, partial [Nesidiocoris tenuis]
MDTLEKTYSRSGLSEQIALKEKLSNLKFRNGSLSTYFEEFDCVVTNLINAGAEIQEKELVTILLSGMPRSYNSVTASLDILFSDEDKIDIHFVKNKLLLEESRQRKQGHRDNVALSPSAFMGHTRGRGNGRGKLPSYRGNANNFQYRCHKCRSFGHKRTECPEENNEERVKFHQNGSQPQPNYRYPSKYGSSTPSIRRSGPSTSHVETEEREEEISFACDAQDSLDHPGESVEPPPSVEFLVDSGASGHLISDDTYLTEIEELRTPIVIRVAKQGQSLLATKKGTLRTTTCNLLNVLYVENLRCNLMSVAKMEAAGLEIVFKDSHVFVLDKKKKVFLEGLKKTNMFKVTLFVKDFIESSACKAYSVPNDQMLWHRRLGHASAGKLKIMLDKGLIRLDNISEKCEEIFCEPCVKGRQTKDFCARYDGKTNRPLELLHSDVCGPISPPTHDGKRYILTFHDDYSKFTYVYLLERKSEVPDRFKEFATKMCAQFNSKISRLRCDNGTEYMNNELLDFCFSQGIRVENTIPYCPFQNGKSEKLNRTLVEKARTLIAEYSLDQELWGEAIYCACYIINRLPTVDNHIPAERWMGEKPNYAKLKTFGCSAYALIPSEKRAGKFEEKSKKMTFVGYTTNGFRLWDADTRKIIRARHVIFDESPPEKKKYLPTQTEEKPEDVEPEDHDETGDSRSEIDDAEEENRLEIKNRNLKKKNQNLKKENRRLEEKEKESTPGKGTPSGTRQRKPPNWLKDFDISAHFAYSAADWISDVPKTRKEIHGREDEHLWEAAIQEELESMEKHKTWTRVEKPKNEEIIDSRWVFRIKKNEATGEERYKARLVAKGFQSSNYADTYSPVGKLSTFRTLISIVNEFNYEMEQMDVKTAFLHGDLKETIFMNLPEEMAEKNHVCKLNRSIYGLKQSPKNWYEKFDEFMLKENFKRSYHDSCLYSKITPKFKIYCFIYVDDLIIASDSLIQMKNFKSKLYQNFDMVNLGNVKSFLGLEVERDRDKGIIKLHQSAYINQLLRKFQMQDCKEISTPIEKNLRLNKAKSDEEKTEEPYRQLVGCLMYLMIGSRPDICFALNYFSRYQEYATNEHWTHLKRVL